MATKERTQHEEGGGQLVPVLPQQDKRVLLGGLPVLLLAKVSGQKLCELAALRGAVQALRDRGGQGSGADNVWTFGVGQGSSLCPSAAIPSHPKRPTCSTERLPSAQ